MFLSLADRDKDAGPASRPAASPSSASRSRRPRAPPRCSRRTGVPVDTVVAKVGEDVGVDAVDLISSGKVDLVVNTPAGSRARGPTACTSAAAAIVHGVACVTTVAAALAAAAGIAEELAREPEVRSLQEYHRDGQLRLEV